MTPPASSLARVLLWTAAGIFLALQGALWFGEGGILDVHRIKQAVALQQDENLRLQQRNTVLEADVNDLKTGQEAIEERARTDLGMIKRDETFYLVTGKTEPRAPGVAKPATPDRVGRSDTSTPAPAPAAAKSVTVP